MAVDGVAGAQAETADLRGRDVDIVRAGQIVGFRRAQEAEAVRQHLDDAVADDVGFARRELLEDREHQLLLAHGAGVFDLKLLGEGDELRRIFGFEFLEFHFPHTIVLWEWASGGSEIATSLAERKSRRSWVPMRLWEPGPDASAGSSHLEPELNCIRLRSVGLAKIGKDRRVRQGPRRTMHRQRRCDQNGFSTTQNNDDDHQDRRYLIDYTIEFLGMRGCGRRQNPSPIGQIARARPKGRRPSASFACSQPDANHP